MANERSIPTSGPADNPTFTVLSNGEQIKGTYSVISAWVMKEVNKIACAQLVLHDGSPDEEDFQLSNVAEFQPGAEIEIQAGYQTNEASIFKGIIIKQSVRAIQGKAPRLCLELKDVSVKLCVGRKNKYFFEATDSEVIEEIIGAYGIDHDIEATDIVHAEMVQYYATDWDFIVSRAEKNGQLVMAHDGAIRIAAPDFTAEPVVNPVYGDSMFEFESAIDARCQYGAVTSKSWDFSNQEILEAEAEEPDVEKQGVLTGADLSEVIGLDNYELQHTGQVKDEELQAWANAQMLKSRLAKIQGRLKIQGFPDVNPGNIVELRGVGDNYNGNVYVSAVRHSLCNGNWHTDIQFGLRKKWFSKEGDIVDTPAAGLLPGVCGLQVGVVTQLEEDPDGEDRVLVKVPVINNDEDGIWARVSTLDAGENRGSFFRPEIGDEVVLGFLNDDPRDPIILGMLNSSFKPAPVAASDDNHEKGFVTRSGMKLMFNDDEQSLLMETPNGNSLLISDDEGGFIFSDENGNSIEMTSSGITLKSASDLNLEATGDVNVEGVNIAQSASAEFKAEGSAGAEMSTSAVATLKGSLVKIN